jgi:hypothetical protein
LPEDTKRRAKKRAMGKAAQMRKDQETERKRKRLLKRPSDNDEDDEDDDDEDDDDDEMGRQPGDGAMPSLHEEEKVIGSIPASDWDDLEQQEEEGDAPQRLSGPFSLHAMVQGEENVPPEAVEADHPSPHGLPE